MSHQAPQIGFDRHLELHWLDAVASWAAAGLSPAEIREQFDHLLATIDQGDTANRKNRTVLTAIWLRVPPELAGFQETGLGLLPAATSAERTAIHFGRCMVTYPFFTFVAAQTGRLLGLQGEVTSSAIYRRVAERYGDRSRVRRSAQHVLSTFTAWRLLHTLQPGRYLAADSLAVESAPLAGWLVEALLRAGDQSAAPLTALLTHPVFFAFRLHPLSVGELLHANPRLDAIQQGINEELILLAQ